MANTNRNQENAPNQKDGGTPQGDQNPLPTAETVSETQALRDSAPNPTAEDKGKLVKVMWPDNEFIVEGHPVLTNDGTRVPAASVKKIEETAQVCGVKLEVED